MNFYSIHCQRILVSVLFDDLLFLFTSFVSKKYFLLSLGSFSFVHSDIFFKILVLVVVVVVVIAVAVVEAAVSSVDHQRERETHCQQCRASERLTAKCRKK